MRKSIAFWVVGVFLLLLGIGFIIGGIIAMGQSPAEYDNWVSSKSRRAGDSMVVTGKLADKESIFSGLGGYQYKFEGSDVPFYSGENIGNKGDMVTVEIEISKEGEPVAKSSFSIEICWIPGIICLVIGIILIIIGFKVRRSEPKDSKIIYPAYPTIQQYPPSQISVQPHAPPPAQPLNVNHTYYNYHVNERIENK